MSIHLAPVSVIVPAYNHARFVASTLKSLEQQTRPPSQVIVIDDCSRDDTAAVVQQLAPTLKLSLQLERHTKNQGLCKTLNEGLALATQPYVAVLASDDEVPLTKFETQVAFLEQHPEFGGLLADLELMNEQGVTLRVDRPLTQELGVTPKPGSGELSFTQVALGRTSTYIQSGLFRRDAMNHLHGFDPTLKHEDLDFVLRLTREFRVAFLFAVGARYRVIETGMNRNFRNLEDEYERILAGHREALEAQGVPWAHIEAAIWLRKANNRLNSAEQLPALWCAANAVMKAPTDVRAAKTVLRAALPPRLKALVKRLRR